MNKTYQELCDELLALHESQAELRAADRSRQEQIESLTKDLVEARKERDESIKSAERLEAELQDRAVNDDNAVTSDIYFFCMELLEPHNFFGHPQDLNGREDEYLPNSVGESMKFLIDFWVENRPKIKGMEEVKAERDALVAHAERLHALFVAGFESGDDHDLDVWETEAKKVLSETPETSLAKRDAEQQKIGAASFRHEIMESVQAPFRPHIQGVFEVWLRRQAGGDV